MSEPLKAGERAQLIIDAALRDGFFQADKPNEYQACLKMHGKLLLTRDQNDRNRFLPSAKLRKMHGGKPIEATTGASDLILARRKIVSIDIGVRLRPVYASKVESLKRSIQELGLKTPITVYGGTGDGLVKLSAGAHRLEAMRQLGEEFIDCFHYDGDAIDAELWEIDENLARSELTPADEALFMHRRKEIHLLKHPETGHGANQHTRSGQVGHSSETKRFTAATAEATGQSERSIRRAAERGAKISEMALHLIRASKLNNGQFLDRLKLVPEENQVLYVKAALADLKAKAAEVKEDRTAKMAARREIRMDMLNVIAERGKVNAGELPRAAFALGYCDFPWEQEAWSDETGQDKGLKYPHMTIEEGKALCAGDNSPFTRDAKIYFWTTTNRIHHALEILKAWGFEYTTMMTWGKVDMGMGREVRDMTEHVIIAKRGDFPGIDLYTPKPPSLYIEKKTEHSRKPVWFAEEIERLHPTMRKLELFQRRESLADGDVRLNGNWHFWGFEARETATLEADQ